MRLLVALALAAPAVSDPPPEDSQALPVLQAMLHYEAAHAAPGHRTCVAEETSPPLDFSFLDAALASAASPEPSGFDGSPSTVPSHSWFVPPAKDEDWIDPDPFDAAAGARLDAQLERGMRAERTQPNVRIPPAIVPLPLKIKNKGRGCGRRLSLGTPVLVGDVAFVETYSSCGSLCGGGQLYAFARQDGRWVPVAYTGLYVS